MTIWVKSDTKQEINVAQGQGNRIKATALLNDAGLINAAGLSGTLLGYNA